MKSEDKVRAIDDYLMITKIIKDLSFKCISSYETGSIDVDFEDTFVSQVDGMEYNISINVKQLASKFHYLDFKSKVVEHNMLKIKSVREDLLKDGFPFQEIERCDKAVVNVQETEIMLNDFYKKNYLH